MDQALTLGAAPAPLLPPRPYPAAARPSRRAAALCAIVALHAGALALIVRTGSRGPAGSEPRPVQALIVPLAKPVPPPPSPPRKVVVHEQPRPVQVPRPLVDVPAVPAAETVAATTAEVPAAPPAPAPAPAPVRPPPAALANAGIVCPNSAQVRAGTRYPAAAQRRQISGDVVVEFLVAVSGAVENVHVVGPANEMLAAASLEATRQFLCQAQERPVRVQVSYSFKIN